MNLPNKLTVSRLCLAPVIFIWYSMKEVASGLSVTVYAIVLLSLFVFAELTDFLDGYFARKNSLVTDLGKVLDPLADVICHLTYFLIFLMEGLMPAVCFIVIVWREVAQSFLRLLAASNGKVMPANIFGKAKTALYAVYSFVGFLFMCFAFGGISVEPLFVASEVLSVLCPSAAVASFVVYVRDVKRSGILKSMTR